MLTLIAAYVAGAIATFATYMNRLYVEGALSRENMPSAAMAAIVAAAIWPLLVVSVVANIVTVLSAK